MEVLVLDESVCVLEVDKVDSVVKDKVIIVFCLVFGFLFVLIIYKG